MTIETLVSRHESLRTRLVAIDGMVGQQIDSFRDCQFELIDLTELPRDVVHVEAKRLAQTFADEQIDISQGPLFQAKAFRLSKLDHVIIVAVDHLISDAKSFGTISREIWTLYSQGIRGQRFSLPPIEIQFADYSVWREANYQNWLRDHGPYWKSRLCEECRTKIPTDHRVSEAERATGATVHIPFGKLVSEELRQLADQAQSTLPMVVVAIYACVMSRWCRQADILINFESHARRGRPELDGMIGHLATPLYLRLNVTGRERPIDLLRQVHDEFISAGRHQAFGYSVTELAPTCTTDLVFNWVTTNWLRQPVDRTLVPEELKVQLFPVQPAAVLRTVDVSTALKVTVCDTGSGLLAIAKYRSAIFLPETIEWFASSLRQTAIHFAQHPGARVIPILDDLRNVTIGKPDG